MSAGAAFKLGTFQRSADRPFAGLVLGNAVIDIAAACSLQPAVAREGLRQPDTILGLLEEWDRAFPALQVLAELVAREGTGGRLASCAYEERELHVLAPVQRPGKMLYAAANFGGHVKEMRAAQFTGGTFDAKRDFMGEKSRTRPYLFLKAPSCLVGAFDDIVIPREWRKLDWEAEMALAIGRVARRGGRRIPAERALEHIAGFMTTNDVSCRDLQFREDRQTLRSDWLGGKNHDSFAPMGPYLVPRQFAGDHHKLGIRLWVNGELKQDGNTQEILFSAEEQIEYVSRMTTLQPGDIFATGTCAGVGQSANVFLKPGDVVETEIEGLGRQRNRVVEDSTD